jgi:hypothetical protein
LAPIAPQIREGDDFTARLEATALLQTLNAELLCHDSATLTLDRWCEGHHLASPAKIAAEQVHGAEITPMAEARRELCVNDSEPIRYGRVRLRSATTSCPKPTIGMCRRD